jgi:hypothetical protein
VLLLSLSCILLIFRDGRYDAFSAWVADVAKVFISKTMGGVVFGIKCFVSGWSRLCRLVASHILKWRMIPVVDFDQASHCSGEERSWCFFSSARGCRRGVSVILNRFSDEMEEEEEEEEE